MGTKDARCPLRQGAERGCKKKSPRRCGDGEGLAVLQPGFQMLQEGGGWSEVIKVAKVAKALTAYNLTIEDTQTYFVAANLDDEPVWVHNCPNPHGRRGSPQTRLEIEAIGQGLKDQGYTITGGADNLNRLLK